MSRELLAWAWAAGAGPGDGPLTIDLDSTICETYGLAKEGARHHGYTGARGYHPLLAIAAGTGDVHLPGQSRERLYTHSELSRREDVYSRYCVGCFPDMSAHVEELKQESGKTSR